MLNFKYRAFISYSHEDSRFAEKLHRELERYALPKAAMLFGSQSARRGRRPFKPVYLDKLESVPSGDLPESVSKALAASEYLIVVASPAAARSEWVDREIRAFCKRTGGKNILAVVAAGEPYAVRNGKPPDLEALPQPLRRKISSDGEITEFEADRFWVDRRTGKTDKRLAFLRIVAAILQVDSLDDLIVRDRADQRRRSRLITFVSATLLTIFAVVTTSAVLFAKQTRETRDAALIAQSKFLIQAADEAGKVGDSRLQMLLALEALPINLDNPERPLVTAGLHSLAQAYVESPSSKKLDLTLRCNPDVIEPSEKCRSGDNLFHTNQGIGFVTIAPNAQRMLTGEDTEQSILWDYTTGLSLKRFSGLYDDGFLSFTFLGSGDTFVASDSSGVNIYSAIDGHRIGLLPGSSDLIGAYSLTSSPDSTYIAGSFWHDQVVLWNVRADPIRMITLRVSNGHVTDPWGHAVELRFSHSGRNLMVVDSDGSVHVLMAPDFKQLRVFKNPAKGAVSLDISPDERRLAMSGDDSGVWDVASGRILFHFHSGTGPIDGQASDAPDNILQVSFSPDGSKLLTRSFKGVIRLWRADTGSEIFTIGNQSHDCGSAAFSPDGRFVETACAGQIQLWSTATGLLERTFPTEVGVPFIVKFAPDGGSLIVSGDDEKLFTTARIWYLEADASVAQREKYYQPARGVAVTPTNTEQPAPKLQDRDENEFVLKHVADNEISFSPDGQQAVVVDTYADFPRYDYKMSLWKVRENQKYSADATIGNPPEYGVLDCGLAVGADFSPKRTYLVESDSSDHSHTPCKLLRDSASLKEIANLGVDSAENFDFAFSNDERFLVTATGGGVDIWDPASPQKIAQKSDIQPEKALFSKDGVFLQLVQKDGVHRYIRLPPKCQALLDASRVFAKGSDFEFTAAERAKYFITRDTRQKAGYSILNWILNTIFSKPDANCH